MPLNQRGDSRMVLTIIHATIRSNVTFATIAAGYNKIIMNGVVVDSGAEGADLPVR